MRVMLLFDNIERTDGEPAEYAEPAFAFLNRSSRTASERVRSTLEKWFVRYPDADKVDLRGRFRSTIDSQHYSAFFELFLHELLVRLACRVEVHPPPSTDVARRPDFLVDPPTGERFYLEAVLATGESDDEAAARSRMNVVYDSLNRLDSPNFFIGMELIGAPDTPPSGREIRSFLTERLNEVDPAEINRLYNAGEYDVLPQWHYEHAGWNINFFPIPKSPDSRGKAGLRPIGAQLYEAKRRDSKGAIRNALITKAGRYGDLDLPYVIAVNSIEPGADRTDVMLALFGQGAIAFQESTIRVVEQPKTLGLANGAWTSGSGPRYTRVSAALLTHQLLPWNVPRAGIRLYLNPWAKRPYSSKLTSLPQAILRPDARMEFRAGESLSQLFNLPLGWPKES